MSDVITKSNVQAAIPGMPDAWADRFALAANSIVARHAPCLLADPADAGLVAEAQLILFAAIERVASTPSYIKAESRGPFSITYVTAGKGLLDGGDLAALASLCGAASEPVGPLGDFPTPDDYSALYGRPVASSWMI